jgi:hypothetical protein
VAPAQRYFAGGCSASDRDCDARWSCEVPRPDSLRSRARQGAARLLRFASALRVTGSPLRLGGSYEAEGDFRLVAASRSSASRCLMTVLPSQALGMGRGARRLSRRCERAVHLGAGRFRLWAPSPLSYLAAPPAHPGELRARIDRCRSALSLCGVTELRPRGSSVSPGLLEEDRPLGIARWDGPLAPWS